MLGGFLSTLRSRACHRGVLTVTATLVMASTAAWMPSVSAAARTATRGRPTSLAAISSCTAWK